MGSGREWGRVRGLALDRVLLLRLLPHPAASPARRDDDKRCGVVESGYLGTMRLRVFPTVEAPRQVRRQIAALSGEIDERSTSDVKTVVSELVTMSVAQGAREPIEICLALDDGKLEGALRDDGPGARALVRARDRRDDSLVLRIVDGLVEEWGASDRDRRIWFRMNVQRV